MDGAQIAHSFLHVAAIKVHKKSTTAREIARNVDALAQHCDGKISNLEGNIALTSETPANDDFVLCDPGSSNDTDSDSESSESSGSSSHDSQNSENDSYLEAPAPAEGFW